MRDPDRHLPDPGDDSHEPTDAEVRAAIASIDLEALAWREWGTNPDGLIAQAIDAYLREKGREP